MSFLSLQCMTNACKPYSYPSSSTELLIRAWTVDAIHCLGIDVAQPRVFDQALCRTDLNTVDLLSSEVPLDGWGPKESSQVVINQDIAEIEVVNDCKRKETYDDLSNPNINYPLKKKKKKDDDDVWPGPNLKLSELAIWCSKAPIGCRRGVAAQTWNELFEGRFGKRATQVYTYRVWYQLVGDTVLKEWAGNRDVTVKEAVDKFHHAFKQARGEVKRDA